MIIFNTTSGSVAYMRQKLTDGLNAANILFEIYEAKDPSGAIQKADTFDIDRYSALGAIGGDGLVSDVLNGMLRRKDKKRLPFWIIPNSFGNAYSRNFGVNDVDDALHVLKKGDVMKMDCMRVLMDYESEADILKAGKSIDKHLQYGLYSADFG